MLIDWFTVGAQFVNFIILVVLLKKLFYRPVLNAMAAREKRVAGLLRDASEKQAAAQTQLDAVQKQERELETNRTELFKKAADEADASRQKLIFDAKHEVAAMRERWVEAVQNEKERIKHDLIKNLQSELLSVMRRILGDLAGAQLENAIVEKFVCELKTIPASDKARLHSDAKMPLVVRSAFEIPIQTQTALRKAIEQELGARDVHFEIAADLVSGIEVTTAGHKLSWNVQDWLRSFERSLEKTLDKTADAHARS